MCVVAFVSDFIISQLINRGGPYWIGFHQFNGGDGEFGWVDNSQVTYTNWARFKPDGGSVVGFKNIFCQIVI